MLEPGKKETHEPSTKNITLIAYIKTLIKEKKPLDPRTANSIVTTSWLRVYPAFQNTPQEEAFLALSPLFKEKANKKTTTPVPVPTSAPIQPTSAPIQPSRWQSLAPHDLFKFIKESPAVLTQVIELGYFPKLLEGNFINGKREDYIDPFYLLSLVLQQENLEAKEKTNALLLLQEKLDITDIAYFNTLKEFASSQAEFNACFKGLIAKERWIKDKNGQYFDVWLPNANITAYIQKLYTSFDKEKIDIILLKAVIANKENVNYNQLLTHNSGGIRNQVYQYAKNLISAIPASFQINIASRRLLENCILNPELRSVFSTAELYKILQISDLHPACHKVIACDPGLRESLISFAKVSNILKNLYRLSPYFYLEQFITEFSEEHYVNFLAEVIFAERGTIWRDIEVIQGMQAEFLQVFSYEKLAPYFVADEQLRDKLIKKFTWEKRKLFEQYPLLLLFALNNVELLQKENDPAKKIVMCLQLMEYRKQGCRIKENLDEHMVLLLDKHLDLVVEKIGDDNKVAKKIYYLAKDEQRKKLMAKNPDLFGSYKSIDDKEETKISSKPTLQQSDAKSVAKLGKFKTLTFGRNSNITKLEVPGLSEELRKQIAEKLDPEFLGKAAIILNNFLQDETRTINLLKDPFKLLAEKLSSKMQEAELAQVVLALEEEKAVLKSQVRDSNYAP